MTRSRGRPGRNGTTPSPDEMLTAAQQLLHAAGPEAFTMRALAKRLGVTPMTIHHHFGDRHGLIGALADQVYAEVSTRDPAEGLRGAEALLSAYYGAVVERPGLTLLIFSSPGMFPEQAQRITGEVFHFLIQAGLAQDEASLWLSILVDFTHGAALATAMARQGGGEQCSPDAHNFYSKALAELLNRIEASNRKEM